MPNTGRKEVAAGPQLPASPLLVPRTLAFSVKHGPGGASGPPAGAKYPSAPEPASLWLWLAAETEPAPRSFEASDRRLRRPTC